MASAAQHLATFGVSVDQARAFIDANINNPQVIFNVASQNGVTNAMLGEIAGGFSAAEVEAFFAFNNIDSSSLNPGVVAPPAPMPDDGLGLIPEEWLGIASSLVALNTETGVLSNASIRSQILSFANISESQYLAALDPLNWADPATVSDAVFSPEELGFSHLGNLSATPETVESLVFGSIIKVVKSIDAVEAASLQSFVVSNETALSNMDPVVTGQLIDLMADVLSTPASPPLVSDEQLSQSLAFAGVALVGVFENGTLPGFDDFLMF